MWAMGARTHCLKCGKLEDVWDVDDSDRKEAVPPAAAVEAKQPWEPMVMMFARLKVMLTPKDEPSAAVDAKKCVADAKKRQAQVDEYMRMSRAEVKLGHDKPRSSRCPGTLQPLPPAEDAAAAKC